MSIKVTIIKAPIHTYSTWAEVPAGATVIDHEGTVVVMSASGASNSMGPFTAVDLEITARPLR